MQIMDWNIIEAIERGAFRVLLYGPPGCIAGDMRVPYVIADKDGKRQNNKGGTIEHLYRRFNGIPTKGKGFYQRKETVGSRYFVPSMEEDGKIYLNEIADVIESGVKPCVCVLTSSGRVLVCTSDHPLATDHGFVATEELGVGAEILMHQNVRWNGENGQRIFRPERYVKHHPHAPNKIVRMESGDYAYKRLTRARAVYEANLNGLSEDRYLERLNEGALTGLAFVEPGNDIHHVDENPLNDVFENLVVLSHADHARHHLTDEKGRPIGSAYVAVADTIQSIEAVGDLMTYDVRMKAVPRNFVAGDGFIVHNTGKTTSAYNAAKALGKSVYNITLSDETPAAELRGHFVPMGTEWKWMHGPAVRAYLEGAVLILDEIDKASQDALDFLHGLLNDPDVARLTLPNGETVTPTKGFQVIATMNGDLEDLQPALQDRFAIAIEVRNPHPDAIKALPTDLQSAAKTVEDYENAERPATLRRWAAFALLRDIPDVGAEHAAKAVFAHRAGELLDAISFKATKGKEGGIAVKSKRAKSKPATAAMQKKAAVIRAEEGFCTCDDCIEGRAWDWVGNDFGVSLIENTGSGFECPQCGATHSEQRSALLCCFQEDRWLLEGRKLGLV